MVKWSSGQEGKWASAQVVWRAVPISQLTEADGAVGHIDVDEVAPHHGNSAVVVHVEDRQLRAE